MDREILFRGKRPDGVKWAYGFYVGAIGNGRYHEIFTPDDCDLRGRYIVNPSTVGQYTGLTDKNGTKIFEGDIISIHSDLLGEMIAIVYYDTRYAWFGMKPITDFHYARMTDGVVIGNVFDNPELLGV